MHKQFVKCFKSVILDSEKPEGICLDIQMNRVTDFNCNAEPERSHSKGLRYLNMHNTQNYRLF